jgi:cell division protein FtsL
MGLIYITYSFALLKYGVSIPDGLSVGNTINPTPFPYRFIIYSTLIIALVYLIVMSETRMLIKTRKLLKEKEEALNLLEKQKMELEYREKNITDSLIYAQRIQSRLSFSNLKIL